MSIYLFIRKYIVLFSVRGNQPRLDFKTDCSSMNLIQLGDKKRKDYRKGVQRCFLNLHLQNF